MDCLLRCASSKQITTHKAAMSAEAIPWNTFLTTVQDIVRTMHSTPCMPDRHAALMAAARLQDFHTKYLAATMAVVLIIGPFFAGHLRPAETTRGRASMLANMRYHTAVIISLFTALGSLASSSRKLMRLGAHAERILELEDTAKEISAGMAAELMDFSNCHAIPCDDSIIVHLTRA